MQVIISEFMDETALTGFDGFATVRYEPGWVDDRGALLAAVADADALIIRNRTQVDADLLAAAPRLKVVGRLGVGLDNIDIQACTERGINVCPATGANTLSVAEYVIAASLNLTRGAFDARNAMLAGAWPRAALIGGEISGRVMGLVGYGGIAQAVATRAAALGMTILAHDPFLDADDPAWAGAERADLPTLLERADILSLHVPLTPDTSHLIGRQALGAMKPGAILINTARGGVMDEAALADALREGKLGGAALDVFETEPLTAEAAARFVGIDNLILTPHIAGVTGPGNIRVSALTVENVIAALARHCE